MPDSKPILKTDDSAKQLIIETLEGSETGGFDLDSVYCIRGHYCVLEFLKCDSVRPNNSHPNYYWFRNKQKFISLWDISQKLEAALFLVNYEDSREQFKVIRVLNLDDAGIREEEIFCWNFDQFKVWFKSLNKAAAKPNEPVLYDSVPPAYQFSRYLPLYTIKAACGYFGDGESVVEPQWVKVRGAMSRNMFVVRAVGHSMEPMINDGDYCIFEKYEGGSRNGEIVLAQHRGIADPEDGGSYSIKEYRSEKIITEDSWQHESIKLVPRNPYFSPIEITEDLAADFSIIAIFKGKMFH